MDDKLFRIPDTDVRLYADEVAVTQTRLFQRLFDLRQLGLTHLIYPAASHSRAAHSIKCLDEANKILRALSIHEKDPDFRSVRMAALLHDIGHIPFSHILEDEHLIFDKHDRSARLNDVLCLLKKELSVDLRDLIDDAFKILLAISKNAGSKPDWRSDLIGNTVCADLLAYIDMDAKWTGIEKRPGYYRIYEYFQVVNQRLCIKLTKGGLRTDIVSAVLDLLDMRYSLMERVTFHHAKCVVSAMLARAVRLCKLKYDKKLLSMGDEVFLDYLEKLSHEKELSSANRLIESLRSRRLYKRIFKVTPIGRQAWENGRKTNSFCLKWRDSESVEEFLCSVEDVHNLPRGSLVLWCPEKEAEMKLARANVVWDRGDSLEGPFELRSQEVKSQFSGVHNRVKLIEDQYLDLWTFWIALDASYLDRIGSIINTIERKLAIDCDLSFRETYLCRLAGFKESAAIGSAVSETFEASVQPGVVEAIINLSNRSGDPAVADNVDQPTIIAAIRDHADKLIKPNKTETPLNQRGLFPETDDEAKV
jgi:uncharacterized protein